MNKYNVTWEDPNSMTPTTTYVEADTFTVHSDESAISFTYKGIKVAYFRHVFSVVADAPYVIPTVSEKIEKIVKIC